MSEERIHGDYTLVFNVPQRFAPACEAVERDIDLDVVLFVGAGMPPLMGGFMQQHETSGRGVRLEMIVAPGLPEHVVVWQYRDLVERGQYPAVVQWLNLAGRETTARDYATLVRAASGDRAWFEEMMSLGDGRWQAEGYGDYLGLL